MRVLFLTHRLPYAPNRGDRIRAYHIIRTLASRCDLEIASLVHDDDEESRTEGMRSLAVVETARVRRARNLCRAATGTLPIGRALTHVLLDAPAFYTTLQRIVSRRRPDVVLAYCSGMARFALEPPLAGLPFVLDMVDVDSAKWANLGRQARPPMRWVYARESRILRQFERNAMKHAESTTAVNAREVDALRDICPDATVHVVGNGVDVETFSPPGPPSEHPTVVFCGVMNYGPNETAAIELAQVIWPQVRAQFPTARLLLVGSRPTHAVRALSRADASVEVTGEVDDVRPYLWTSAVAAAPLRVARGVQNKVLEALAAGLPVVITPVVREGLPQDVLPGCLTEESSAGIAQAICGLLARSAGERRALATRASLESLTWRAQLAPLYGILNAAARREELTSTDDTAPELTRLVS